MVRSAAPSEHFLQLGGMMLDRILLLMIHRNGEVWDGPGNGVYTVEAAQDYQYELLLGPDGSWPNSLRSWNGIPLFYNRAP